MRRSYCRSPTVETNPCHQSARSIIYLGLDVHKESITVAVLPAEMPAPTRVDRLPNDLAKIRRYCERLAAQGRTARVLRGERCGIRAAAGDAGVGLSRAR